HRATVEAILGRKAVWNAKRSIELGITDWHSSPSEQHFAFSDDDLARVSDALSLRLLECRPPDPELESPRLVEATVQVTLENKLLTYYKFEPVRTLVVDTLKQAGLRCEKPEDIISCFAEAASLGVKIDKRAGGTRVLRVKDSLIKWRTVTDS